MQLIANLSLMWTELPLADRFAAAARAGFDGAEIQFPYEADAKALKAAAGDLPIALINVLAAGPSGAGLATDAGARGAFAAELERTLRYAEVLEVRKVNVLGLPPPAGQAGEVTEAVFADNVRLAAEKLSAIGIMPVVEAVNPIDVPGFWLDGLGKALGFLDVLGDERVRLQFDFYHMARTEPDLVTAIEAAGGRIGHVQFADDPGRNEPGTGGIDFASAFAALRRIGYDDVVSAEYRPAGRTDDGLGWMAAARGWLA
jgi:hydroxypyruvate isomerase